MPAPLESQPVLHEGCWGLCSKQALTSDVLWCMHLLVHALAYVVCAGGTVKLCLQCLVCCVALPAALFWQLTFTHVREVQQAYCWLLAGILIFLASVR